jgi:nucleotide-binding universal stress UspA family protein
MPCKTILVHLNDQRRAESLLGSVLELAKRHHAHLIGMHVYAALPAAPVSIPYARGVIGGLAGAERKASEEIEAIFKRMTVGHPFGSEWRGLRVPHVDLASEVMAHGRSADLIVAAQTDAEWDLSPLMDFPEQLALESGRPVLVIPHGDPWPEIGRKAVVAWKPGREAARAVFDALPLLRQAETVKILEAGKESAVPHPAESGRGLAAALARHGIEAATERCAAPNRHAGEAICDFVSRKSADLLVMGAYGHSRFREILFGGATRHVARHMPAPTLFSH